MQLLFVIQATPMLRLRLHVATKIGSDDTYVVLRSTNVSPFSVRAKFRFACHGQCAITLNLRMENSNKPACCKLQLVSTTATAGIEGNDARIDEHLQHNHVVFARLYRATPLTKDTPLHKLFVREFS